MIAPNFPPVASAGVFRTLRFAKYLMNFGWEPLVLGQELPGPPEAAGTALLEQLPAGLIVNRAMACFASPKQPSASAEEPPAATESPVTSPRHSDDVAPQAPAGKTVRRRLKDVARNSLHLMTETPDKNIRWVYPAVRQGLRMVREYRPSVLYTSGPPHSTHIVGSILKRLTGLPWVADFRDPWARRPWGNKTKNPWGQALYPLFEKSCIKRADRIILNTDRMADDFRAHYRHKFDAKICAIPNGCDPELAATVEELLANPAPPIDDGFIRLCHPGSLYRRRDPRPLMDAIGLLAEQGIRIKLEQIGHCADYFDLENYVAQRGLTGHLSMEKPIPHREVLGRMAAADLLLLIQPGTPIQIPGKLFEMLLFRKPIVGMADEGATSDLIQSHRLGAVARDEEPETIATAIHQALDLRKELTNADHWTEVQNTFDGETLTGRLAELFDSLTGGSSPDDGSSRSAEPASGGDPVEETQQALLR